MARITLWITWLATVSTAFAEPSLVDWNKHRQLLINNMQQVMGPLPGNEKRGPLEVKFLEETACKGYVRFLVSYQSEPGSRVPAYLLVPNKVLNKTIENKEKLPAVLCLHPTDDRIGHRRVTGLGDNPTRQYAKQLAERGYVTIAPSYPLLANYQPDLDQLGYESGTMKAIWDNIRAIDLLISLPYVKQDKIGAIGHSLGGHNAVYTAVFDQRIKVVVSSCGLDSYKDYKGGDIRGWTSVRYMPKLLKYKDRLNDIPFDFDEMISALAPRYCFISAPLHDSNFQWKSVDHIAKAAKKIYQLYDAEDRLQVQHPDCGHDFPDDVREEAYQFIDNVLRRRP